MSRHRLVAAIFAAALAGCAALRMPEPPRNDELFGRVEFGMTQPEVRRLLGAPDDIVPFERSRTLVWDYAYQDTWGYLAVLSVTFDAGGRAVGKLSFRTNDGGDQP
jgi:outer membrane protein assembly factor BamE (lipoprotein component of BamABCDE complex)